MRNYFFNIHAGGVHAEVVIVNIAPFKPGVVRIVARPVFINAFNLLAHLLFGNGFIFAFGKAALNARVHIGVNKHAMRIFITQNIVGASAYDNAVGLIGKLFNNFALPAINLLNLPHIVSIRHKKALPHAYGINGVRLFFYYLLYVIFRKRGVFGYGFNYFFIVISYAQLFGESAPEFPAAASELATYCYYFV